MRENGIDGRRNFSSATLTLVAILAGLIGILVGAYGMHVNILERLRALEVELDQHLKGHGG